MTKPASEDLMSEVHRLTAEWALSLLRGELKETVVSKDGEVSERTVRPTAAEIAVIRAFLKDNDITCAEGEDNAVARLKRQLVEQRSKLRPFDPERDLDQPVQ